MTLLEPDVSLTDYGLAIECTVLAWLAYRSGSATNRQRFWFVCFFGATAVAASLGGTAHGFFPDKQSFGHLLAWNGTLLAIGLAALAAWAIGAPLVFINRYASWIVRTAAIVYVAYAVVVIFVTDEFLIAIVHYLPAALFLLLAFLSAYRRSRRAALLAGALGMVLTFLAAGVQQAGIGLHPRYFDHNALYHLIQAVALVLIYLAARSLLRAPINQ